MSKGYKLKQNVKIVTLDKKHTWLEVLATSPEKG